MPAPTAFAVLPRFRLAPQLAGATPADRLFTDRQLVVFLFVGVAWRVWRYFLQFPLWPDEAFVTLNLLDRGYAGLAEPLRFIQVAPYLFLATELTLYRWLGGADLVVHLPALVAGLAGLFLFVRLARRLLEPDAAVLAVGILAVSYFCVQYSAEVKPYSLDLCVSVVFLLLGQGWLNQECGARSAECGVVSSSRCSPFLLLVLFTPVGLGFSYPAVFVAGGVAAVAGVRWLRRPTWRGIMQLALFGAVLLNAFGLHYWLVGVNQFRSAGAEANPYWGEWFFPGRQPLAWPKWLWDTHAGAMLAYPLGQRDGQSAATLLLVLAGVGVLVKQRRPLELGLLLAPFGLTLFASALQRYPYGGNARVAQHLAPALILLAGLGGVTTLRFLFRAATNQRRAAALVATALILLAIGGMARDAWRPAKSGNDLMARQLPLDLRELASPQTPIILLGQPGDLMPSLEWYLKQGPNPLLWADEVEGKLDPDCGEVLVLALRRHVVGAERSFTVLRPGPWAVVEDRRYDMTIRDSTLKEAGHHRLLRLRRS